MSLSIHEIGFESLDGLSTMDSLCLFIGEDERPLKGTAGYVDWRLCGRLSRVLIDRFFTGAPGDCLLVPSSGKIAMERIFAVGIGSHRALGLPALSQAMARTARLLSRAQVRAVALEIPGGGQVEDPARAAALLNDFLPAFAGTHVAVLTDKGVSRLLSGAGRPAARKV